jgi:FtsH-binding integral membrane protein
MRAELVLMGKRVDMALRTRRRALVVLIYAAIAAVMISMWFVDQWRATGTYIFWAAMLACRLFLGGYYSAGLVKPFTGKGPRQYDAPPPLLLLKLRLYQPVLDDPDRRFRNDERELKQRDRSHYQAYQAVGMGVVIAWFAAYMGMLKPAWLTWIPMTPFQLFYALMLVTLMLFLTLPQCILLWTEPDLEPEG